MRGAATQILLIVQIALIGLLVVRVYDLGMRVDSLSQERSARAESYAALPKFATSAELPAETALVEFDMASQVTLRQIVREELETFSETLPDPAGNTRAASSDAAQTVPPDEPADPAFKRRVDEQLYSLIAQGQASQAELIALENNIARLPPAHRRQVLGELNKAVNDGRLDARF
ncbi:MULTISPECIES: hypothetical protein [Henriciella]|jgi:hypothetical protein|uniref:Periplasmic heavy metal sensor n=1 Tax=Henriciella pelagia TaxID=1977912 RepID=A0ABQ1JV88_9PROT|nr:hypothetical protein [Henriciella pelagia]GGB79077.1 hypothetical protein GCM10011503_29920 [Henriciella pelagia]